MDIVIAGGGIGGLCAAMALRRAGHEVRVLERATSQSEVGAGITLWPNALAVLDELGLGPAIRERGERSHGGVIALSDGTVLAAVDAEADDGDELPELIAIHRRDLQDVLYAACEDAVSFGSQLAGVELLDDGRPRLQLSNGGRLRCQLLIGADGLRSRARVHVMGEQRPRYAGYTCWRGVVETPEGYRGPAGEYWGVGDRVGVVPIGQGLLYWFAVATAPEGTTSEPTSKDALLARFGEYAFDVADVIAATDEEAILHHDIYDRAPAEGWHRGRVVLLGDAAHPTTPNMGQGAAMALESAAVLTRCLDALEGDADQPAIESALARYELNRRARTRSITNTSFSLGKMAHYENAIARAARNSLFRFMPKSVRDAQLKKLGEYNAWSVELA